MSHTLWTRFRPLAKTATRPRHYHELSFVTPGIPSESLRYVQRTDMAVGGSKPPSPHHVGVDMLFAPLNPADLNTIEGVYPNPPDLETRLSHYVPNAIVVGSEGIGRVRQAVAPFEQNDLVVVGMPGIGTMRSFLWVPVTSLLPMSPQAQDFFLQQMLEGTGSTPLVATAPALSTLPQLGGTALRMLTDFQSEGTVIQNSGNSGVGFMASQLAHTMNRDMVSIIRRGTKSIAEWDDLVKYLSVEGKNTIVIAEEDLMDKEYIHQLKEILQAKGLSPVLALNGVGGRSATLLANILRPGGTMVTYGGMSKNPVTMATGHLIFKDLKFMGYWHSRWMTEHGLHDKKAMLSKLFDLALQRRISCAPVEEFGLADFQQALRFDSNQSGRRRKVVFRCQEHLSAYSQ